MLFSQTMRGNKGLHEGLPEGLHEGLPEGLHEGLQEGHVKTHTPLKN